jgi:hypothetical protein
VTIEYRWAEGRLERLLELARDLVRRRVSVIFAGGGKRRWLLVHPALSSKNSKANRIETMKGPAESGQICSVGRRKIAKKIAKNKRCYANTLRPCSRMLLKVMKGG